MPNRQCFDNMYLKYYRLIGQLLGCCLYSEVQVCCWVLVDFCSHFSQFFFQVEIFWANSVWNFLSGKNLTQRDLHGFSVAIFNFLKTLENMNEEQWGAEYGGGL